MSENENRWKIRYEQCKESLGEMYDVLYRIRDAFRNNSDSGPRMWELNDVLEQAEKILNERNSNG